MTSPLLSEEFMTLGISLQVLRDLKVDSKEDFLAVQQRIKRITQDTTGNKSLASHLYQNEKTRHLVGKADYFVSHAWGVSFGETLEALEHHFKGKPMPFLWMSIALVDQHVSGVNFDMWTGMFKRSLNMIGKALLMLSPAEKPIAISRSWCCYEWMCIAQENSEQQEKIAVEYCVNPGEVDALIERMKNGRGNADFLEVFAGINVEKATAFKESEERAILQLMREVGVKEVNDIILLNVKDWLLDVASEGEKRAKPGTKEGTHLLDAKANLHYALGELDAALLLYRRALESARKVPDGQHLIAMQLNNLAQLWSSKGDYAEAEKLQREAMEIRGRVLGKDNPLYASDLNNLAQLLSVKGDYAEAEPLYREAITIGEKTLGRDHPDVATRLNNLAQLLSDKGDNNGAMDPQKEAIAIWVKAFGNDHPYVATGLNNLAQLLQGKGDYDGAMDPQKEAIAVWKKSLGNDHPQVATGLNNLAVLSSAKFDYAAAEPMYRDAITLWKKALGDAHPEVATGLNNLAQLLSAKGDYGGAMDCQKKAIAIWKKAFGDDHPAVANGLNNLAQLLNEMDDCDGAIKQQREAVQIQEKTQGGEHPQYASRLNNLAQLLWQQGKKVEAKKLGTDSLAIRIRTLGPNHPSTIQSIQDWGQ